MPERLVWSDYSLSQLRAIAETLASAIAVAEHAERRCLEGARYDDTGAMRNDADYYSHAARYLRWVNNHLQRHRARVIGGTRNGNTNAG